MIRFFVRLAIAALVDWLTWQISTPHMRLMRVARQFKRRIEVALEAARPAVEEFYWSMSIVVERWGVQMEELEEGED